MNILMESFRSEHQFIAQIDDLAFDINWDTCRTIVVPFKSGKQNPCDASREADRFKFA